MCGEKRCVAPKRLLKLEGKLYIKEFINSTQNKNKLL